MNVINLEEGETVNVIDLLERIQKLLDAGMVTSHEARLLAADVMKPSLKAIVIRDPAYHEKLKKIGVIQNQEPQERLTFAGREIVVTDQGKK